MLTKGDKSRSDRALAGFDEQIRVLGPGWQRRLRRARVIVVGVGRIGSTVIPALCASGVGDVLAIDGQILEAGQIGIFAWAGQSGIGQNKAAVLARSLDRPGLSRVTAIPKPVEATNFSGLLNKADLVICCANRLKSRLFVEQTAVRARVPSLQVAVSDSRTQLLAFVTIWRPERADLSCYGCFSRHAGQRRSGALLTTVTGFAGQCAAHEAVLLLSGVRQISDKTGNLLTLDLDTPRIERLIVARRPDCEICKSSWRP